MSRLTPQQSFTPTCFLAASALILTIGLSNSLLNLPSHALDLGDGRISFEKSPLLVRSATSFRSPAALASYQFTIENLETIRFFADRTRAFLGDSFSGGPSLELVAVQTQSSQENKLEVVFDQPVEPGNTVTVSVRGRNPLYGGVYQFGITAFPPGENSPGLYLGVGRLHFSSPGGRGG